MIDVLTKAVAVGGEFDAAKVGLATNADILTNQSTLADIVPPTYGGYAPSSAVVWGTVRALTDGSVQSLGSSKQFVPTDSSGSSMITYVTLINGAGDKLLAYLKLDEPVHLGSPNDLLTVCFPLVLANSQIEPQNVVP